MDELLEQFLIEGRELVQQASDDLLALEREPTSSTRIDSAFRAVHTLKGSTALFDFAPMTMSLHAAEDLLGALRAKRMQANRAIITALLDCVSTSERWLDDIERTERLPEKAVEQGNALRQALSAPMLNNEPQPERPSVKFEWLSALLAREAEPVAAARKAGRAVFAIRYVPNVDSFFQGDDPLAIIQSVPELLALHVAAREPWDRHGFDPFRCNLVIETLSAAPIDGLRRIFRFVGDQATIVEADRGDSASTGSDEPTASDRGSEQGLRSLRVDASRIDALVDIAGELIVAKNSLAHLVTKAQEVDSGLARAIAANHSEFERLAGDMRRAVMRLRTVPLAGTFRRFPRLVRDTAERLEKDVEFTISGQDVEADKSIVDGLFEPLLHVLRNALDHGIEATDTRRMAGKAPKGRVTLDARRESEQIVVEITDDGGGIDPTAVRRAVVAKGLMTELAADAIPDGDVGDLIFTPGMSTSTDVTDISGRGVGMDAVRSAIEMLGGRVDVASKVGAGTSIRMTLPQTVLVTPVMTVRVGEELYGVPVDAVAETARLPANLIKPIRSGEAFAWRDRTIPLVKLSSALGLPNAARNGAHVKVLIAAHGSQHVGLEVDAFVSRTDVLLRPMTGLLSGMPGTLGTALLGDGRVLIVLDIAEMIG